MKAEIISIDELEKILIQNEQLSDLYKDLQEKFIAISWECDSLINFVERQAGAKRERPGHFIKSDGDKFCINKQGEVCTLVLNPHYVASDA